MHNTHPNLSKQHAKILNGLDPKDEAYRFIMNHYPGVQYVEKTDSYLFNGYEFDYAFCGYNTDEIFYKLKDKEFGDAASYSCDDDWSMFIQVRDFLVNKKFEKEYGGGFTKLQSIMCVAWFCVATAVVIVCGYYLIVG